MLNIARMWQNSRAGGAQLPVTLAVPEGDKGGQSTLDRYPELERQLDVRVVELDLEGEDAAIAELVADATSVYVGLAGERRSLATALALASRIDESNVPIVLALADQDSGLANAVPRGLAGEPEIHTFGVLSRTCVPELVLRGTTEFIAQAQHESYARSLQERGVRAEQAPFLLPWDQLPEEVKDKNRRFADHVGPKLDAVGCVAVPAPLVDPANPGFSFSAEEIERLAVLEHERWCADQRLDGYRYAPVRDDVRKLHPSMIPWSELSEDEREKDRQTIRDLPAMLARVGFEIYRA